MKWQTRILWLNVKGNKKLWVDSLFIKFHQKRSEIKKYNHFFDYRKDTFVKFWQ